MTRRTGAFWMQALFTVLHNTVLIVVGGAIVGDVAHGAHPLLVGMAIVGAIILVAVLAAFRDTFRDECR